MSIGPRMHNLFHIPLALGITIISLYACLVAEGKMLPTAVHNSTSKSNATSSMDPRLVSHESPLTKISTIAVGATGAVLNILLIIAIIVDPLKILRRGAWITILNLAFADLVVSVANILDIGLNSAFHDHDSVAFRTARFVMTFGVSASFTLLTLLTVQTYVVSKYPIKGRLMLTGKKTAISCMVTWLLAVPYGLSNIAYLYTDNFSMLMKIYIAQIAGLELIVFVQVILKVFIIREIMKSRRNTQQQNNRHKEVAKTIIILNFILIVTALPFFVLKQLEFVSKLDPVDVDGDYLIWKLSAYYQPIAAINYMANPILYALRLPDYKRTILVPFTKYKGKGFCFFGCPTRRKSEAAANTGYSLSRSCSSTTTKL